MAGLLPVSVSSVAGANSISVSSYPGYFIRLFHACYSYSTLNCLAVHFALCLGVGFTVGGVSASVLSGFFPVVVVVGFPYVF